MDIVYIDGLFGQSPTLDMAIALGALVLVAIIANFIVKRVLLRFINKLISLTRYGQDSDLSRHNVIGRLSNIVPALVITSGIALVPHLPEVVVAVVHNVAAAFIVLTVGLAITTALDLANTLYNRRPDAHNKPIKGYIQILKIAIFAVTAILIIATLIDKSPVILLSGLGAMAAVLMLVFQDTLLSLVASVQISSSDMVRVGDWIEMPQLNADGDVIDIALHTVKVQNWDRTITTLPTRRLISDPFKNWRGMQESGGRRIKRAIQIDQTSIHFLTDDERRHLRKFSLIEDYISTKEKELTEWNDGLAARASDPINARRLTNIGTFRAYVKAYLENHPNIHQGMIQLVRQLAPSETGLPIEVYCFTSTIAWGEYEGIQSDIFDHLYSILPEFGLRAFQQPSGADLKSVTSFVGQR